MHAMSFNRHLTLEHLKSVILYAKTKSAHTHVPTCRRPRSSEGIVVLCLNRLSGRTYLRRYIICAPGELATRRRTYIHSRPAFICSQRLFLDFGLHPYYFHLVAVYSRLTLQRIPLGTPETRPHGICGACRHGTSGALYEGAATAAGRALGRYRPSSYRERRPEQEH